MPCARSTHDWTAMARYKMTVPKWGEPVVTSPFGQEHGGNYYYELMERWLDANDACPHQRAQAHYLGCYAKDCVHCRATEESDDA